MYRDQIIPSVLSPDLTPYCLRHTFCTDLQRAGAPLNAAKELTGDKISITFSTSKGSKSPQKQYIKQVHRKTKKDLYEQLQEKFDEVMAEQNQLLSSVKDKEQRIAEIGLLIKHTSTYREHKPVYERYKKSADKEKFLRGQESSIILFEAAARALKQMGVQKLPDTSALQKERDTLMAEKQKDYTQYQKIRKQAKEMETIKRNVDSLLSIPKLEEKVHVEQRE